MYPAKMKTPRVSTQTGYHPQVGRGRGAEGRGGEGQ